MISLTSIDRSQALRYAGFRGDADEVLHALADSCEQRLLPLISPKYIHRVCTLDSADNGILCREIGLCLTGEDIAAHLKNCTHAVLFCATLSQGADRAVRMAQTEDVAAGLLTDAMASAAIEQVCDSAESEILAGLPDFHATWRFSPGYGDLPLALQGEFLDALDAPRRIGVCVSDSGILIPRKSVTAILGLCDKPIERHRKGCAACNFVSTCPYRAKGVHCQ